MYAPVKFTCDILASSTSVAMANFIIKALKFSKEKPAYIYITTADSDSKKKYRLQVECLPLEPKHFEIQINIPAKLLRQTVEVLDLLNPNCPVNHITGIGPQKDDFIYGYTTAMLHY